MINKVFYICDIKRSAKPFDKWFTPFDFFKKDDSNPLGLHSLEGFFVPIIKQNRRYGLSGITTF